MQLFSDLFCFFWQDLLDIYSELTLKLPEIEEKIPVPLTKEIEKKVFTPPPLEIVREEPEAFLTQRGVIEWTNIARERYGLPPLRENTKLNLSAKLKAEDMFEKQYFSHYSPEGIGVEDLVKSVEYEFIAIGENLALGNFLNDEALVEGWMESPGHRENILSANFQEIGVAVIKNEFEERITWIAVQHFGLPLSACEQPDQNLLVQIEENQEKIEDLKDTLEILKFQIKTIRPKRGTFYFQKIKEYNNLVLKYNNLVEETEILVDEYNDQVSLFNKCITGD